jgi:FHS family L-fucose permease-like MFS transporter
VNKHKNFIVVVWLFFGLGFVTCLNDLLTPILKQMFALNYFQANFVAFAFFTAYFIGSLLYVVSSMLGFRFFINLGYKGLILLGLILAAIGCLLFIPAAMFKSYPIFLVGLFAIGFGFTYLQIAINPLALILGDPQTGASRLNLAQAFNSFATAIAPLIGVYVFYEVLDIKSNHSYIKYPYIFLCLFFLVLAYMIYKGLHTNEERTFNKVSGKPYALNHANLLFGAIAIFFYVGSEVSIGTNLISYLKSDTTLGLSDSVAGKLLTFYWGGAMIGRFLGSVALSKLQFIKKALLMLTIAIILTIFIVTITHIAGINLLYYVLFEALAIILFLFCRNSRVNLIFFSIVSIVNLLIGAVIGNSWFAAWAILSIGLFNSVMFPNIFDLALDSLGQYREQGSSFLIMMILGGAILPVMQGFAADMSNIVVSFLVPVIGYLYILLYSVFYSKKQLKIIK